VAISVCFTNRPGYQANVRRYGGIGSDFEHLEGGKRLWKSFVCMATDRGLKISLLDTVTGQWMLVDANTPDEFIWSQDDSKKSMALVLEA
jgi:hypothetical protein